MTEPLGKEESDTSTVVQHQVGQLQDYQASLGAGIFTGLNQPQGGPVGSYKDQTHLYEHSEVTGQTQELVNVAVESTSTLLSADLRTKRGVWKVMNLVFVSRI